MRLTTQVYRCNDTRCRYVEERQESIPQTRKCPKCGKKLVHEGQRTIGK